MTRPASRETWLGLRLGLAEIGADLRRSVLSVFSIFLGVSSLLLMLGLQRGMSRQAQESIDRMGGASLITLRALRPQNPLEEVQFAVSPGLTYLQVRQLLLRVPNVAAAFPEGRHSTRELRSPLGSARTRITGVTYAHFDQFNMKRSFLLPEDEVRRGWEAGEGLCFLGPEAAKQLFPGGANPAGRQVVYDGVRMKVAGLLLTEQKWDFRNWAVFYPWALFSQRFAGPRAPLEEVRVKVKDISRIEQTLEDLERFLLKEHRGVRDFSVETEEERIEQSRESARVMALVGHSIAGMALLVGGIGILNLMLASITSRIREIGVRKALGAGQRSLFTQFLTESALISSLGTVLGMAAGSSLLLVPKGALPWRPGFTAGDFLLCAALGLSTGLLFGLYPALKASRLTPVEALRHA